MGHKRVALKAKAFIFRIFAVGLSRSPVEDGQESPDHVIVKTSAGRHKGIHGEAGLTTNHITSRLRNG